MEALRKKWNSDRGASILMAMLFLLVCMMAGASILMAAASNTGKVDSNRTEQQKYLAVSSAMNMLVDELQGVTYVGNYTYARTDVLKSITLLVYDEDGNVVLDENGSPQTTTVEVHDYFIHTYTQGNVSVTGDGWLDDVLPLREHFDYVFFSQFEVPSSERTAGDGYVYNKKGDPIGPPDPGKKYELTFQAPEDCGDLKPVKIEVVLRSDGSILLTATPDDDGFTMMALLEPRGDPPDKQLVLSGSPGIGGNTSGAIKWELKSIFKQEATGG